MRFAGPFCANTRIQTLAPTFAPSESSTLPRAAGVFVSDSKIVDRLAMADNRQDIIDGGVITPRSRGDRAPQTLTNRIADYHFLNLTSVCALSSRCNFA
jgi:hypothetical protein